MEFIPDDNDTILYILKVLCDTHVCTCILSGIIKCEEKNNENNSKIKLKRAVSFCKGILCKSNSAPIQCDVLSQHTYYAAENKASLAKVLQ